MGPGYIATAQTAPLREVQPDGSRHPFDQFITAKTPAGRWGEPDDMVGPCVFLASHASDFVNGPASSLTFRPDSSVQTKICMGLSFYEAASSLSYKTLLHVSSC